jgi:hypothetical protein
MSKRQAEIPGTERETDAELDVVVDRILDARARRLSGKQDEDEAVSELRSVMRQKELTLYTYFDGEDRYDVELEAVDDRVSVRRAKSITAGNGAADDLAA